MIGLGRFGSALARELCEYGEEVLVVDKMESNVRALRELTENAFVTNDLSQNNLREMGVHNCSTAIVCIGDRMDTSILTSLHLVNLGVPRVIAKATSYEHGEVLSKLGVEVVYPERDMAIRLAKKLTANTVLEYINLSGDIEIAELEVSKKLAGKMIRDSKIRQDYRLNIIAIEHDGDIRMEIDPNYVIKEDDILVIVGKANDIQLFEDFMKVL